MVGCGGGASSSRDISDVIVREAPEEWQQQPDGGLQPEEPERRSKLPIARLPPRDSPIVRENPF
jgi:hypothetical protein